jgi:hypothetical protein
MRVAGFSWRQRAGCVAVLVACSLAGAGLVHLAYRDLTEIETGENAAKVEWLPSSASNVSYYKSYSFTAYEFDINEAEFVNWSGWNLSPITSPIRIARYCFFAPIAPKPDANSSDDDWNKYATASASRSANIADGIYYKHVQTNGGGVSVAYDRQRHRAYFQSSPR